MSLYITCVTKNEADRYLKPFVAWCKTFAAAITIYDDQSTDDTAAIAEDLGAIVKVRPDGVPSFLEHEGLFREAAWRWTEQAVEPKEGDWFLSLDADEFYVDVRGEAHGLVEDLSYAESMGAVRTYFKIPEIFAETPDSLYRRIDGYWDTINSCRAALWEPDMVFPDKVMASGSTPNHRLVGGVAEWVMGDNFQSRGHILHLGYLEPADRKAKYERYSTLTGHSSAHVESILRPEVLEIWDGPLPFRRV